MKISLEAFQDYQDNFIGYCPHCKEFGTEEVDLDTSEAYCDSCGGSDVHGMDQALLMELISINEEDEEQEMSEEDEF